MKANNMAAMHEALMVAIETLEEIHNAALTTGYRNKIIKMCGGVREKLKSALSEPPRNCDEMPDIDKLTMNDLAKSPCKSTLECASREELLALVRWLLATATERKGGKE